MIQYAVLFHHSKNDHLNLNHSSNDDSNYSKSGFLRINHLKNDLCTSISWHGIQRLLDGRTHIQLMSQVPLNNISSQDSWIVPESS